jgi:hypothetical protein
MRELRRRLICPERRIHPPTREQHRMNPMADCTDACPSLPTAASTNFVAVGRLNVRSGSPRALPHSL